MKKYEMTSNTKEVSGTETFMCELRRYKNEYLFK